MAPERVGGGACCGEEVAKPACGTRQASHSRSLLGSDVTLSLSERYTLMEDVMTICRSDCRIRCPTRKRDPSLMEQGTSRIAKKYLLNIDVLATC